LTANNEILFSGGKDDKHNLEEENKDNRMPRDGQSQQYNASTPQARGTVRRKIRDEEEQIAVCLNVFRVVSIRRETQWLKRGLHIIEIPATTTSSQRAPRELPGSS
jgi:hypothetical protein